MDTATKAVYRGLDEHADTSEVQAVDVLHSIAEAAGELGIDGGDEQHQPVIDAFDEMPASVRATMILEALHAHAAERGHLVERNRLRYPWATRPVEWDE